MHLGAKHSTNPFCISATRNHANVFANPLVVLRAVFEHSPKFNRNLPVLFNENVAKSRRILIHTGNTGVDTAGCILVGNEWSANGKVFNSINTINTLFSKLKMKDFEVEIRNRFLI